MRVSHSDKWAELLVRVAARLVPYPLETALRHQRGHACHLGLHTRRVLVALPFDKLQRLFREHHSKQQFRITFVQKVSFSVQTQERSPRHVFL